MGSRGNIVVTHPGERRIYLYTHNNGRELAAFVRDGIENLPRRRWDDAAHLTASIAQMMLAAGIDPDLLITPLHTEALDHDELHLDPARGVIARVTMDLVIGADGAIADMSERVADEWSFDEFLSLDPE